jgi:selenocysteine lyase/cysteine desulfurase
VKGTDKDAMTPFTSQRHLFDIPDDVAYFNCAYNSPQLNRARDRMVDAARSKSHPWTRTPRDFFDGAEQLRVLAAEGLGGDTDGWAVIPAASYGISTAARVLEPTLSKGDQILVMAEEFPSNILPWRRTAKTSGATVVTAAPMDEGDWTCAVLDRIGPSVKVVAVSPCHWTDGSVVDLIAVGRACKAVGATFVVDATQAMGASPLALRELEPDFLVASGYKWLLCPYGFGLMYVGDRWRDSRPLEETWLARAGSENFASLVHYVESYRPGARRFDVGETCAPTLISGAIVALEQIRDWTVLNVSASLRQITERIACELEPLGFRFSSPTRRSAHIIGAKVPVGLSASTLVEALRKDLIYVSQRGDAIRFSPHLHVTQMDVDRLIYFVTQRCRSKY